MGFRFIHSADWQLGRPFAELGPELGGALQRARIDVVTRLATLAREEGARHVLVAGDVWDQEVPSPAALRQPIDRMAAEADVTFWLLPGNHDPAGPQSFWRKLAADEMPANVRLLLEPEPTEIAEGIVLLPAPWTSKEPGRDLTAGFDAVPTAPGARRIGLAHGSVQAFGNTSASASVIDPNRAAKAGLDYLALGDWHGLQEAAPLTWYAGTPEPDRFRNNIQGKALVVDLDSPDAPQAAQIAQFRWEMAEVSLFSGGNPEEQVRAIVDGLQPLDRTLLRLVVKGNLSLAERDRLDAFLREQRTRLAYLRIKDQDLGVAVAPDDLDRMLGEGPARSVAERLIAMKDGVDAEAADDALRLLGEMAGR